MIPIVYVFDTVAFPNFIQGDYSVPSRLDNVRQRDMPDIRGVSNTKINMFGTITVHQRMSGSRSCDDCGTVNELVKTVLLASTYIDRFIKSIYPAERIIVPHQSPLIAVLMLAEAKSESKKNNTEALQKVEEELALLVTYITSQSDYITVAGRIVFMSMCKTSLIVSTKASGLVEVFRLAIVIKIMRA